MSCTPPPIRRHRVFSIFCIWHDRTSCDDGPVLKIYNNNNIFIQCRYTGHIGRYAPQLSRYSSIMSYYHVCMCNIIIIYNNIGNNSGSNNVWRLGHEIRSCTLPTRRNAHSSHRSTLMGRNHETVLILPTYTKITRVYTYFKHFLLSGVRLIYYYYCDLWLSLLAVAALV